MLGEQQSIWDRFKSLSTPRKLLVSVVVNVVLGVGIGGVAEWATYKYAIAAGVRPPFEGIPYLSVAVVGLGIGVVLMSAVVIAIVSTFFGYVGLFVNRFAIALELIDGIGAEQQKNSKSTGEGKNPYLAGAITLTGTLLVGICGLGIAGWIVFDGQLSLAYFSASVGAAALAFLDIIHRWIRWAVFLGAVLTIYVGLVVALSSQATYERAIGWMRYGGSIPVVIHLNCKEDSSTPVRSSLILRTSNAFLIRTDDGSNREYPADVVCAIDYLDE